MREWGYGHNNMETPRVIGGKKHCWVCMVCRCGPCVVDASLGALNYPMFPPPVLFVAAVCLAMYVRTGGRKRGLVGANVQTCRHPYKNP